MDLRLKRLAMIFRHRMTFRWIPLLILSTWLMRSLVISIYCGLLHTLIFRWTRCQSEDYSPYNFTSLTSILFDHEPAPCGSMEDVDGSISIVVFVPVHVLEFDRRHTIRATWARPFIEGKRINGRRLWTKFLFVIGSLRENDDHNNDHVRKLRLEAQNYGDILQLSNTIDDYYNITLKIRAVLHWTSKKCPLVSYLVRADSDIVLDYGNLMTFLTWLSSSRGNGGMMIAGYCRAYDCVTRWSVSKTCLPWNVYRSLRTGAALFGYFHPRYCFGFSYILSKKFVDEALNVWTGGMRLSTTQLDTVIRRYWPLDDIYLTGYTAEIIPDLVPRFNHPSLFQYQTKFDQLPCLGNGVIASAAYENDHDMVVRWRSRARACQYA